MLQIIFVSFHNSSKKCNKDEWVDLFNSFMTGSVMKEFNSNIIKDKVNTWLEKIMKDLRKLNICIFGNLHGVSKDLIKRFYSQFLNILRTKWNILKMLASSQ